MRRRLIASALGLVAVGLLLVTIVGSASSATRRADVTVSDLGEPPDFTTPGSRFRVPFAVANMGDFRAGRLTVQRFQTVRFFFDQTPDSRAGRVRVGQSKVSGIAVNSETSRRARLRIPATLADGSWFLVACADATSKIKESKEKNNCRISGQSATVGATLQNVGPQGNPGAANDSHIDRFTLPIGRPTVNGFFHTSDPPNCCGEGFFGDDEKSNERKEIANVGGVQLVADCKRTTNGDEGSPEAAPGTTASDRDSNPDENGDEAKILVYNVASGGTVTFNSVGQSSRRNIPPGEGTSEDSEPEPNYPTAEVLGTPPGEESDGGEGGHMAIAAARDPDPDFPAEDWAFAYKVNTIYITHSNGTQLLFTGFAGIDVAGAGDNCIFGGTVKVIKAA
jgi:hypothetical protein